MQIEWKSCLRVGISVFLLFLCIHYWESFTGLLRLGVGAAAPLLTGCVIAYIINILMSFYERHYFPASSQPVLKKSRRPVCMIGAFLTLVAILAFLVRLVVPEVVACIRLLLAEVPGVLNYLVDLLSQVNILPETLESFLDDVNWKEAVTKLLNLLYQGVGGTFSIAAGMLTSVVSGTMNLIIGLIFSIYLLMGKDRLRNQLNRLMNQYIRPRWNQKVHYLFTVLDDCFHRYIVGQCTEAVILGALCTLGMLLFQFPYATMIGAVIGFSALIPVAGAYIGGAIGFLLIFTVSPAKAVLFLVYLVILQQLEGNLIYPRVVGTSIGLPGLWVLSAVTVGGGILGIGGMLLGVPVAAAVYRLIRTDLKNREAAGIQQTLASEDTEAENVPQQVTE